MSPNNYFKDFPMEGSTEKLNLEWEEVSRDFVFNWDAVDSCLFADGNECKKVRKIERQ